MSTALPALVFEAWQPAKETLHLWCQIIGKTKLALTPQRNHWWNVALYVSPRGLTTHRMPAAAGNLEIEVDLVGHRLRARTAEGEDAFDLVDGLAVAEFYARFEAMLGGLGVGATIHPEPSSASR